MKSTAFRDIDRQKAAIARTRRTERLRTFEQARELQSQEPARTSDEAIRRLRKLRVHVDKWYIKIGFRHENHKQLSADWKKVEERLKQLGALRKLVSFSTHIILAVRAFTHLRKGYQEEIRQTEGMLRELDELNLLLARKGGAYTLVEITNVEGKLVALREYELTKKKVAIKKIVAAARIDETTRILREALEKEPKEREIAVRAACAMFTSARNRLGKWREKQIAGIMAYNEGRGKLLKVVRDAWVKEQLKRFADDPRKLNEQIKFDEGRLQILQNMIKSLEDGWLNRKTLLLYIKENAGHFRVPQRKRDGAELAIDLSEKGVRVVGKDILIGHYAYLWRYVKSGDKEGARRKLEHLKLFINANKPRFILDELRESNERELEPVLIRLEKAVDALEQQDFKNANEEFERARRIMESL